MVNSQTFPLDDLANQLQNSESTLATMQADIDAALQERQQSNLETVTETSGVVNLSNTEQNGLLSKSVETVDSAAFDESQLSRVIEMAWEDRTPFAAIEHSYGLNESAVIKLMRQELKPSSFRLWRERVTGRDTKHQAKRSFEVGRAYCKTQYKQR